MTAAPKLLYLDRQTVSGLLPSPAAQRELAVSTFALMASGGIELPPKPGVHPRPEAFVHAMPAYVRHHDITALKWIAGYPGNPARGLPYLSGLIILNDPDTGLPCAVLDAAEITAARTAAVSAVCIRRFAKPGWRRVAIIGFGEQGRYHASAIKALNPSAHLRVYDPRVETSSQGDIDTASGPREAVRDADVVITATPLARNSPRPLVRSWIGEPCLVLPLDFDTYVHREVATAADLFLVDDVRQYDYYKSQGYFSQWPQAHASVGEVLSSGSFGSLCVVANLGIGGMDAMFASAVVMRARSEGTGVLLER